MIYYPNIISKIKNKSQIFTIKKPKFRFNFQNTKKMFQLLALQNIAQIPKESGNAKPRSRSKFTPKEDEQLTFLVESIGVDIDWKAVAKKMPDRTPRQCKERWINYLAPNLDKSPWKEEEDQLLIKKYEELGPRWKLIAQSFPNRTEINVKNRMKKNLRKQIKNQRFAERLAMGLAIAQQNNTYAQYLAQLQAAQNLQKMQQTVKPQIQPQISTVEASKEIFDDYLFNDANHNSDDFLDFDSELPSLF